MSDDGLVSPSLTSSVPPPAQGQQVPADLLRQHPVWQAAAGRAPRNESRRPVLGKGRVRGGGGSEAGDVDAHKPRYERISLSALEADQYCNADGADSRIDSDDENDFHRVSQEFCASRRAPGPEDNDDASLGGQEEEESEDERPLHRQRLDGMMGAAAFGGASRPAAGSDAPSRASESSSKRRRDASREAFPVRGITCVGCALPNRIGPVNRFIQSNISSMTEDALWKMASLTYKRDVCEPAEREGAAVPGWSWKEIRAHYELHVTGNFIARHKMVRQLQCMRAQLETRLVRVDGEDKEVDRQTADLMLKTLAVESRERQLLEQASGGPGKRGRGGRGDD